MSRSDDLHTEHEVSHSDAVLPDRERSSRKQSKPFALRESEPVGPSSPISTNPQPVTPSSSAAHILVMDDSPEILDLLGQALGDESYSVTLASWLLDLDTIIQLQPDLIIMEAMFNLEPTGIEFIHQLRAGPGTSEIPLVCFTIMHQVPQTLIEIGIPLIAKPFDLDDIVQTASALLSPQSAPAFPNIANAPEE